MKRSSASRATGVRSFQLKGTPVWRGVVKRLDSVMMIVWASPFLPLTWRKPSAPAPPALFTTMMGRGESLCFSVMPAMRRAIWSAPPPVPAGMTNSMGFVGSHAAWARLPPPQTSARTSRTTQGWTRCSPCRFIAASSLRAIGDGLPTIQQKKGPSPRSVGLGPAARSGMVPSGLGLGLLSEGGHGGDLPGPHLVHLGLEVRQVFLGEVGEAALLQEVLPHGLARPPLHHGLGLAVVLHAPVLHLVEGEDAALDGQLPKLVREHRVVVPALGARVQRVDEGGPADREGL